MPGRRCAKGPTAAPLAIRDSTMTQKLLMFTWSPISASAMRTCAWISQARPIRVGPSMTTPGWMTVSPPISARGSM